MYERIVIIGSAGAGKSTLAQKLGPLLNIEVIHLDRHFWQPDWKEHSIKTRIVKQQQLIREKDQWIIEGTYLDSSDIRLNAADTIIFLDIPGYLCLWRVIKRRFQDAKKVRPDLPEGCREQLSIPYILKVLVFPQKGRRLLLKKIKDIRKREEKESALHQKAIFTCRSNKDLENLLLMLSAQTQIPVKVATATLIRI